MQIKVEKKKKHKCIIIQFQQPEVQMDQQGCIPPGDSKASNFDMF